MGEAPGPVRLLRGIAVEGTGDVRLRVRQGAEARSGAPPVVAVPAECTRHGKDDCNDQKDLEALDEEADSAEEQRQQE